jgi:hypothetical protein
VSSYRRPARIVAVDDMMNPKGTIKLCGQVCKNGPGKHKDWLCHQPATKLTGRCITHSPKDAFIDAPAGRADEVYKRSSLIRELGLHKDFGDHRNDPELLELKHELALIDVRVDSVLRLLKGENTAANDKRLIELLKVRRQYVESIYKTTANGVPKERVVKFIAAMMSTIDKFIPDAQKKAEFLAAIREISGRSTEVKPPEEPIEVSAEPVPEQESEALQVIDAPA